jgi:hypothetical protein
MKNTNKVDLDKYSADYSYLVHKDNSRITGGNQWHGNYCLPPKTDLVIETTLRVITPEMMSDAIDKAIAKVLGDEPNF